MLRKVCVYENTHLQRLVKPAVPTVPLAASSMQHLDGSTAAVRLLRPSGYRSVQTQGEDAPLDRRHRLFVGIICTNQFSIDQSVFMVISRFN